ncbi:DUF3253 domain-containing protein [Thalassococcus sp. S3]|uniref:DUF3253 domain-containing protein n=1 Tax=Thalassococcus sp. S3 TaxID=2017482 RepID=UPI0010242E34|nr:DUF3253 domain-containing protein [Thalassococcus sp. S3]QBF32994.1 S-adenosylmethionine tRNA ribosyltransferase [Thalassococcus sp. S3]
MNVPSPDEIQAAILSLVHERGNAKTCCPSDVARRIAADWRPLMPAIREQAIKLTDAGRIVVTQKGKVVDPRNARGPIRLSLPR